mmetsp:Transcript_25142/g.87723  ORF Transcript_25142/g.87723 Transcript_25142/m.87723 type:complete len:377 (+) Transcript_25142:921-2051(+)
MPAPYTVTRTCTLTEARPGSTMTPSTVSMRANRTGELHMCATRLVVWSRVRPSTSTARCGRRHVRDTRSPARSGTSNSKSTHRRSVRSSRHAVNTAATPSSHPTSRSSSPRGASPPSSPLPRAPSPRPRRRDGSIAMTLITNVRIIVANRAWPRSVSRTSKLCSALQSSFGPARAHSPIAVAAVPSDTSATKMPPASDEVSPSATVGDSSRRPTASTGPPRSATRRSASLPEALTVHSVDTALRAKWKDARATRADGRRLRPHQRSTPAAPSTATARYTAPITAHRAGTCTRQARMVAQYDMPPPAAAPASGAAPVAASRSGGSAAASADAAAVASHSFAASRTAPRDQSSSACCAWRSRRVAAPGGTLSSARRSA